MGCGRCRRRDSDRHPDRMFCLQRHALHARSRFPHLSSHTSGPQSRPRPRQPPRLLARSSPVRPRFPLPLLSPLLQSDSARSPSLSPRLSPALRSSVQLSPPLPPLPLRPRRSKFSRSHSRPPRRLHSLSRLSRTALHSFTSSSTGGGTPRASLRTWPRCRSSTSRSRSRSTTSARASSTRSSRRSRMVRGACGATCSASN